MWKMTSLMPLVKNVRVLLPCLSVFWHFLTFKNFNQNKILQSGWVYFCQGISSVKFLLITFYWPPKDYPNQPGLHKYLDLMWQETNNNLRKALSDFHKIIIGVLKQTFQNPSLKELVYRDHKNLNVHVII